MTDFIETPRFPDSIAYGARGGPRFHTQISQNISGAEARQSTWDQDKGEWDLGLINRTSTETEALLTAFAAAKGRANGFRFHDFQTGEGSGTSEYLGTGDGTTQIFQLLKWYTIGSESYSRTITKPVSGTTIMTLNGTVTTPGYVSTRTGLIYFNTPPSAGVVVRGTFDFDVPVRFDTDWLQLRRVDDSIWSWEQCTLLEISDPVAEVMESTPVAIWKCNEAGGTLLDSAGANPLTQHNSIGSGAGQIAGSRSFNGTNQYASCADTAALSMGLNQSYTLVLWLNVASLVNGATPLNKGQLISLSTDFEYVLEFYQAAGGGSPPPPIELLFLTPQSNPITQVGVANAGLISTNTWHLVIAWYDSTPSDCKLHIQVDNGLVHSSSGVSGMSGSPASGYDFNLGSSGVSGGFCPCSLDAVRVYKSALNAAERSILWAAGHGTEA